MYATIATDKSLTINLKDIITDGDFGEHNIDVYSFVPTGDPTSLKTADDARNPVKIRGDLESSGDLFQYYTVSGNNDYGFGPTLKSITFTCISSNRLETATCYIQLSDGSGSDKTSKMAIHLTVGNTQATVIEEKLNITVQGVKLDGDSSEPVFTDNIVNYVNDINKKDMMDVTTNYDAEGMRPSYTYHYIKDIKIYASDDPDETKRPVIYGPGMVITDQDGNESLVTSVCGMTWTENFTHQTFGITPMPGVYGTQKVEVIVEDSGYTDGMMENVVDSIFVKLVFTITVARPMDDITLSPFEIAEKVTRKVTPELLLNTADEPHNADGYTIENISVTGNLAVVVPTAAQTSAFGAETSASESSDWGVTGNIRGGASDVMTVTFAVGGKTVKQDFAVNVTENHPPKLKTSENLGIYSKAELNDGNIKVITPDMWFYDDDIDDVIRFVSPLKVKVSAYVDAHLDGSNIILAFKGRGTTELTVSVSDSLNQVYSHTIVIGCSDMEELNWWHTVIASIQTRPLLYGIIFGIILLLIILLIIILVIVHKKRKMRREIEALINSETELEEEMMRLNSGFGATRYQSYGYLPPTTQVMNDPGLMLGSAADNPTPNNLQLGMGTGDTLGAQDAAKYPQTNPKPDSSSSASTPGGNGGMNGDGFDPDSF